MRMRLALIAAAAAFAAFAAGIAGAAQPGGGAPAACELHVRPTPVYRSDISGLFGPGSALGRAETAGVRRAMEPNGRSALETFLSPAAITAIVGAMDMAALASRPIAVTFHQSDRREADRAAAGRTRATSSAAPCYYELHVELLMFQKSLVYGYRLYPFWRLKDFTAARVHIENADTNVAMPGFPIGGTPEQLEQALAAAFRTGLERFLRSQFHTGPAR